MSETAGQRKRRPKRDERPDFAYSGSHLLLPVIAKSLAAYPSARMIEIDSRGDSAP
jgi:hypothetical protein